MRKFTRILAALFIAVTLCLSSSSFAQDNSQQFVDEYSNAADGPLSPTAVGDSVTGNDTYGYGETAEGNSDNSLWVYGGLVFLALVGIGLITFISGALKRRRPPQQIQLK